MAKKKTRQIVTLESSKSKHRRTTVKNPKNTTERLELKKYDPVVRETAVYKEKK